MGGWGGERWEGGDVRWEGGEVRWGLDNVIHVRPRLYVYVNIIMTGRGGMAEVVLWQRWSWLRWYGRGGIME